MNNYNHKSLSNGRWQTFSLMEQLGNIGSEINRTIKAKDDKVRFNQAVNRCLELFDLTLSDIRWKKQFKEIARAREIFCDSIWGNSEYNTSLENLNTYFYYFALAARANR